MAHVSLIWLFIVIITMLVSLSVSCVSVQTGMSDLEGKIYEPWIRWKSESESKSERKKMCGNRCDNDNMQGPVIPECAEAKGLKGGQEMDKNGTSYIAFMGDYVVGKTVLLRAAANKAA